MRSEEQVTQCDVATTSRRAASAFGIANGAGLDDPTTSEVDESTFFAWHEASTASGEGSEEVGWRRHGKSPTRPSVAGEHSDHV